LESALLQPDKIAHAVKARAAARSNRERGTETELLERGVKSIIGKVLRKEAFHKIGS
jgi:hypothetical protein